jgi:hypothetical protein
MPGPSAGSSRRAARACLASALAAGVVGLGTSCGGGGVGTGREPPTGGSPAGTCTGAVPAHATPCAGAESGLTSDAPRSVRSSCACDAPCEVVPCSYACDPGWLASGGACVEEAPAPIAARLVDNADGTVTITDRFGRLTWLRDANCTGLVTWTQAMALSAELAAGACGLRDGSTPGDWRLPSEAELLHLQAAGGAGAPFVNVQVGAYWSSFSYLVEKAGAVDMFSGQCFDYPKDALFDAWAVRN